MQNITLPDGKKLNFKNKTNGLEIAEKISKSLIKQALIMSVNGELKDLSYSIPVSYTHLTLPTNREV